MGYEKQVLIALAGHKITGRFDNGILIVEGPKAEAVEALAGEIGIAQPPIVSEADTAKEMALNVFCNECNHEQKVAPATVRLWVEKGKVEGSAIYGSAADFCDECGSANVVADLFCTLCDSSNHNAANCPRYGKNA